MKNIVDLSIFLIFQYLFFTFIFILLYQGGNILDPFAKDYVLSENFLSDLALDKLYNGEKNSFDIFYRFSLTIYGIGLGLFFWVISKFCRKKRNIPLILGVISGIGIVVLSFFWSVQLPDTYDIYNKFTVSYLMGMFCFLSFYMATITLNYYVRSSDFPHISSLLLFLNVTQFIFLVTLGYIKYFLLKTDMRSAVVLTAVLQKIVVLVQIFVELFILIILRQYNSKINIL